MVKDLKHVGILGMHWGVRTGGSSSGSGSGKGGSSRPVSADYVKAVSLKKKKLNEMSNDEIRTLTNRMQLEKQYKDLNTKPPSAVSKFVTNYLTQVGQKAVSKIIGMGIEYAVNKVRGRAQRSPYEAAKDIVEGSFLLDG